MVNLDEVINACKVLKAFCEENVSCDSCPVGDGFSCAFSFMDGYIEAIEEWIETMTKWHEAELKLMPISEEYWSSLERKEELLSACSMLIEYLEPMVCNQDECDDCSFCAGDVIYTLEELKSEIMKSRRFNDDNT